jgi:hypothetical protein
MLERPGSGLIDRPHDDLADLPGGEPQNLKIKQKGPVD